MARLIDADALDKAIRDVYCKGCNSYNGVRCRACWVDDASIAIDSAPTIDAVPVVRCKDCKNRGTPYSCPMRKLVMPFQGAGSYEDCTEDYGYCHMGAKKDGGAENV